MEFHRMDDEYHEPVLERRTLGHNGNPPELSFADGPFGFYAEAPVISGEAEDLSGMQVIDVTEQNPEQDRRDAALQDQATYQAQQKLTNTQNDTFNSMEAVLAAASLSGINPFAELPPTNMNPAKGRPVALRKMSRHEV